MTILVVDDEEDVISLFKQRFRREIRSGELSLAFAHSAQDALALLAEPAESRVVLILSDINMPGMSGLELLRVLKERRVPSPVVMITAYDNPEHKQMAQRYGADGYLTKPLDFDELRAELARLSGAAESGSKGAIR